MRKILLIEDDRALAETLTSALEAENYVVISTGDGGQGLQIACEEEADLILLDMVLPSMGGFEVCQKLRAAGKTTPLMFMTGEKKDEIDKVLGLELGGDDYIIKPFGIRELLARIKAILRRAEPETKEIFEYSFSDIRLNFETKTAFKGENELYLTVKEFGLLKLLIQNEGAVVSRETILNDVWGYDIYPTTRTVDTFIRSLRKKIEEDPSHPRHLITVPWAGYKFVK
jgi:DNA-binding response OmpR family regulator